MPSLPNPEMPRRTSFPSAFPKGPPSNFIDFFDFRFKRYLTPWIVRHVWLWGFCLLALGVAVQVARDVYKSLPTREVVRLHVPYEAQLRKNLLDRLLRKTTPDTTTDPKTEFSPVRSLPEPEVSTRKPKQQKNWEEEYGKMSPRQLKAERQSLEEKFPETGERWTSWSTFYLATAAAAILGTILTLVVLRVCCEVLIVVFNIATTLTAIADNTAMSGKSPRD